MSNVLGAALGPARPKNTTAVNKPLTVEVKLDQHFSARVYTSGSTVCGNAIVRCHRDTAFEKLEITLTGTTATRLDFVQAYASDSVRTFMRLRMPISNDDLPSSRVFRAGEVYTIPFHFVVPNQLTVNACNHGDTAPAVQDHHLRLPPTIGYWDGDDQAPDMTHVEYAVKARIVGPTGPGEQKDPKPLLLEGKKIIKVLPSTPEEPPLDITSKDERYCLSKTKPMRKNIVGPKAGELTASASQPRAVMIHADGFGADESKAIINLRWTSSANTDTVAPPPKIHSVSGKIVSTTYFGNSPSDILPNLGPKTSYTQNQVLSYSVSSNLFNTRPEKLSWLEEKGPAARRDSGYVSDGPDDPATTTRHTAQISVPVKIPISQKKAFVPTFYNCLISRTYTLQLVLSVGPANTTMTLNVPLQLGVQSLFDPTNDALPSFETAMAQSEEAEADAYLRPRVMQVRAPQRRNTALPDYHDINGHSVAVA